MMPIIFPQTPKTWGNSSSIPSKPPLTPDDEALIASLAQSDMFRAIDRSYDSDRYSNPLSAFEVTQRLSQGKNVVVTHPHLGTLPKRRIPEESGVGFVGPATPKIRHSYLVEAVREATRQGTFIADIQDLKRYVQANGFDSKISVLTKEESQAATILQKYQGSVTGEFKTVLGEGWDGDIHWFVSKPDSSDKNDGLYDPQVKKGGFLGFGGHPDRLTPYEAIELLNQQKAIQIVKDGARALVHNLNELQAYDRLA